MAESPAVVVLDMEASAEHMSRGTVRYVDGLLVIVEPYYRSLEAARRLVELARELDIPRVAIVANKVRGMAERRAVAQYCRTLGTEVLAWIPFDESIAEAEQMGRPVLDAYPAGPFVKAVESLIERLQSWRILSV